ncbi:Gfo/Idh/MocA family oxidoreductase [Paraglaciecola aquimarina]|uniref:Gfo/Idh/MocA family oxidoreductase n=1 Tax=Paraglaciecola aquimarina TaxID=1235557 RepID=A0ABU3STP9_9ALTE|nr:Gfo/Idh/MocA family oxidoreductase [Paraglaciecola aquimarina]MDU0353383.1 Gfo/Idh/MocA family oxidoreductase [Paraglaciecola aquimarina]
MSHQIIKLGVIGLGNIAQQHINNITSGAVKHCKITALCARNNTGLADELGAQHFNNYQELIDSAMVDAVLIATPTLSHFAIAKYALEKGLHVMLEKPIGLSSWEGAELVKIKPANSQFALMLNQRTDPTFIKMKALIDSGVLGDIQRTHWTMTNWFRPDIYFQVSDWRATWKGEGGGLLVNQCIHNLDIFQWICGVPSEVTAFCEFGKYHNIEVEDEVTAYLRYNNQATGVFIGSTGEAYGVNRFDIIGDKGSIHFENGKLSQKLNDQNTAEFCANTNEMFGMPTVTTTDISTDEKVNQHAIIMNNFIQAIHGEASLIAPAEDGLASLDIANAMLQSTWNKQSVSLPLDREKYQQLLTEKASHSALREKSNAQAKVDMNASYR